MKFIKLTSCVSNKAILIRDTDVITVESMNYDETDKSCCRLVLNTDIVKHEVIVWETIDHVHGLLK